MNLCTFPLIHRQNRGLARSYAALLLVAMCLLLVGLPHHAAAQTVPPVLEFPETGLDEAAAYRGYTTRFFKDAAGNTLQVSLDANSGRVVNLWADAANESISFTARDAAGRPAIMAWESPNAEAAANGKSRYVQFTLSAKAAALNLGHLVLNTMRLERDFQYFKRHELPFDAAPFIPEELTGLIGNLERLPVNARERHLALLNAKSLEELRSRLQPRITLQAQSRLLVEQFTFDGKNRLSLELGVDGKQTTIAVVKDHIAIQSTQGGPIKLSIKIGTDSPALTPLRRDEIFNGDFFRFYERVKSEHDSLLRIAGDERGLRFKRLERQVKSMELMSFQEKLVAGLPNYATYFGRDMMMSALMLEPILQPAVHEHVIASVLKKLLPSGEVSHEEGLGSQAIREHAAEYNKLLAAYFQAQSRGEAAAERTLAEAEKLLGNLQAVTENYHMVDDDFQLPVLAARYLARADIPADRKRAFLLAESGSAEKATRLALLLRNFGYVSQISRAYVEQPVAANLVSFRKIEAHRWHAGSWRDSGVGYANGRYAMDINAIWVPQALAAVEKILATLRALGIADDALQTVAAERLSEYARDPATLARAIKIWRGAKKHFAVSLAPQQAESRISSWLDWLAEPERIYWRKTLTPQGGIEFLALALDESGRPIPVANTDVGTLLFLENFTGQILTGETSAAEVLKLIDILILPYPRGLLVKNLGPLVANDAYATPEVWEGFKADHYHSPRVVWGREANLILLGLSKQILAAYDDRGRLKSPVLAVYVRELRQALNQITAAVEASGLKHSELWSYRLEDGTLSPSRYAASCDIQLWNLTNLAVQNALARIPRL